MRASLCLLVVTLSALGCPSEPVQPADDDDDATDEDFDCDGIGDSGQPDGSVEVCPGLDCASIHSGFAPPSGLYWIDPAASGASYEVWCDMETSGGGWTLALVTSDDGQHTWTWSDRTLITTVTDPVGDVRALTMDFKSPAHHDIGFTDLLFVHAPSGVTAEYEGVGPGTVDLANFIAVVPLPQCGVGLADNGHPLTGGTLTLSGGLCDTDLYFNLGDHDNGEAACWDVDSGFNNVAWGPAWNVNNNTGCPFDDPATTGLGPRPPCDNCSADAGTTEGNYRGFGNNLGLNTGMEDAGENSLRVYVR